MLSNPELRARYDRSGAEGLDQVTAPAPTLPGLPRAWGVRLGRAGCHLRPGLRARRALKRRPWKTPPHEQVDFMDSAAFFSALFGSEMFDYLVGELAIATVAG